MESVESKGGGHSHWTGQSGRMIFNMFTIPVNGDDGKILRIRRRGIECI